MTPAKGLSIYNKARSNQSDELVRTHAPLVKKIALHLLARLPASVQLDDLMQSGMIGLLEAARRYEPSLGASFETYAGIRIRGAIVDEIRRGDWVPRSVHRNARRIAAAIKSAEDRLGRDARDSEVAEEMGVGLDEYHGCLNDASLGRLFSLDELTETGDGPLADLEGQGDSPFETFQTESFQRGLASAIEQLPEREKVVLALYYQEELNLKEIGAVLGVSESRVSQIHGQAALRLRSRLSAWF